MGAIDDGDLRFQLFYSYLLPQFESINDPQAKELSIYSKAAAAVAVDVSGYYSAASGSGTGFSAEAAPVRI